MLALGPLPEGLVLGPISIHVATSSSCDKLVRVSLSRSHSLTEENVAASRGPIQGRVGSASIPAGWRIRLAADGDQASIVVPWGIRTPSGSSWVLFATTGANALTLDVVVVVGVQELIVEGTPVTGPVTGFRRRVGD